MHSGPATNTAVNYTSAAWRGPQGVVTPGHGTVEGRADIRELAHVAQ